MSDSEKSEAGDDIHVEVSAIGARAEMAPTTSPRSPFEPRYTRRQRLAQVSAGLLVLAIVLSGITGVGGHLLGLLTARTPTSAPTFPPISAPNPPPPGSTFVPADNQFYLLPNPPGVAVSLDGRVLASTPIPGDSHPLQLARGHHVLTWHSQRFPFVPLRCAISVPHASADTCPFANSQELPAADAGLAGHVIAMHDALDSLPAGDATQLTEAIQAALDTHRSQATVQPGERYFFYQQGENGGPVAAAQPLRASLRYDYQHDTGYFEPCNLAQPAIPCRFPGQDCSQLCTVPQPPPAVVTSPGDWIAAGEVQAVWTYTTLDGQVVARDLGEAFGIQLAVLRITWDSDAWHVTPVLGTTPGLPATDDIVCDPARFWLGQNGTWAFMVDDPPPGARTRFISDSVPADGCLAVLNPYPRGSPSAIFLERFGVLLSINATADDGGSAGLPLADAAEQQMAQQLAATAGFTLP